MPKNQAAVGKGREGTRTGKKGAGTRPDRHDLYELCAQDVAREARVLRAVLEDCGWKGGRDGACVLGEDFCGTAALSAAWNEVFANARAVAVDHDREVLAAARIRGRESERVRLVRADVMSVRDKADLIAVLNFSICERHSRRELVAYLKHARSRLSRGGVLLCDLYGGADAFRVGTTVATVRPPGNLEWNADDVLDWGRGTRVVYTWEQRQADPLRSRVVNAMHFELRTVGKPARTLKDAFVYDWRLWTVSELREAMTDAGFRETRVYPRTVGAVDADGGFYTRAVDDAAEVVDDAGNFNVFVVGRV